MKSPTKRREGVGRNSIDTLVSWGSQRVTDKFKEVLGVNDEDSARSIEISLRAKIGARRKRVKSM